MHTNTDRSLAPSPRRVQQAARVRRPLAIAAALLALAAAAFLLVAGDLEPQVESDFFFASDDPSLAASRQLTERFGSAPQLLLAVESSDRSRPETLDRLRTFGDALREIPGVTSVRSLVSGPASPQAAAQSPLWSRLVLGDDPRISQMMVELGPPEAGGDLDTSSVVAAVERAITEHRRPDFEVHASGVPWVVEQVRAALARDLRVFGLASLAVFGLVFALVYRSPRLVLGGLLACLAATALALAALGLLDAPIGLLTANLVPIVFVLTLSHLVFLIAAARAARAAGAEDPAAEAVARTLPASAWCAFTTVAGFGSLLWASAQPLRELGTAGALASLAAILLAYTAFPPWLGGSTRDGAPWTSFSPFQSQTRSNDGREDRIRVPALVLLALAGIALFGLPRLETDPPLLDSFGGSLRQGLATLDEAGGSSPLELMVRLPRRESTADGPADAEADTSLTGDAGFAALERAQEALEGDPQVGTALSLPILVAEARSAPFAFVLSRDQLVDLLEGPSLGGVSKAFLDEERQTARILLRMRETDRPEPRRVVVDRLRETAEAAGLEVLAVGGLFHLAGALGELVASSLVQGLAALFVVFGFVAFAVARSAGRALAMLGALAVVPVLVLGASGLLGVPVDIISSPASNVALALGIDSMIHLVASVRRRWRAGAPIGVAWSGAREALGPAILGATLLLVAGFGLFALSTFPPSRRFGLSVAGGALAAAAAALYLLPFLARALDRAPTRAFSGPRRLEDAEPEAEDEAEDER